jgi:hypothetical protein
LINYNQQFDEKLAKGHVPAEYKPLGVIARHDKKSNVCQSKQLKKLLSGSMKVKFNDLKSSINEIEALSCTYF